MRIIQRYTDNNTDIRNISDHGQSDNNMLILKYMVLFVSLTCEVLFYGYKQKCGKVSLPNSVFLLRGAVARRNITVKKVS